MFTARPHITVRLLGLCGAVFLTVASAHGQGLPAGAIGRLGASPLRHGANVSALALSADGRFVVSVGWDGKVKVWDIAAVKLAYETTGTRAARDSVDISADGSLLAAPGTNNTVLHDLATRKVLRTVPGGQACFAPDGKLLATAQYDLAARGFTVLLAEVESGKVLRSCGGYATKLEGFAFAPNGATLAGAGEDGVVYVWDVASGKETARGIGHRARVESVAFAPDGKRVVSASHDGTARLWDAATGKEERRFGRLADGIDDRAEWASRVALSPDGQRLFVLWSAGATATVIDLATGRTLQSLRGNTAGGAPIGRVVCGTTQTMASLSGPDGVVHVTDLATGRELTPAQPAGNLLALAVTSDARTVALCDFERAVTLWDVASGKQRQRLTGLMVAAQSMTFSPDGALLATGSTHETVVSIWDVATGKEVRQLYGHVNGVRQLGFAADARSLLVLDGGGVIHRWEASTDREINQHWLKRGFPGSVSADGRRALMRYFDPKTRASESRLVDVASGKTLAELPAEVAGTLSPDGQLLASLGNATDKALRIWGADTGRLLRRIDVTLNEPPVDNRGGGGSFLLFANDGRSVVAAQGTRAVRLWEVATGLERRRLVGHATPIRTAALSPDSRILATAGADGTVYVWDLFGRHGPAPKPPTPGELTAHWNHLAGGDGGKAFTSVCILARAPEQMVPFAKERLRPVLPADPQKIARLVADLDAGDFTTREKASVELEKLGDLTGDALHKVLDGKPALEPRQRIEKLLEKIESQQLSGEHIRTVRALEVLEAIGTPEARQVIAAVAQGAPRARLTREAQATLTRLADHDGKP